MITASSQRMEWFAIELPGMKSRSNHQIRWAALPSPPEHHTPFLIRKKMSSDFALSDLPGGKIGDAAELEDALGVEHLEGLKYRACTECIYLLFSVLTSGLVPLCAFWWTEPLALIRYETCDLRDADFVLIKARCYFLVFSAIKLNTRRHFSRRAASQSWRASNLCRPFRPPLSAFRCLSARRCRCRSACFCFVKFDSCFKSARKRTNR